MQKYGHALRTQARGVFSAFGPGFGHTDAVRSFKRSYIANVSPSGDAETNANSHRLHSVISVHEGPSSFASATVTFQSSGASGPIGPASLQAAQMALLALRGALGSQRPPSAVVAFASRDLPRSAVQQLASALSADLGRDTPIVGCSSGFRIPDERRPAAGASLMSPPPSSPWYAPGFSARNADSPAMAAAASAAAPPLHITLAAAHLPNHELHAIRSETSSLPRLPHIAESLQGRRPPMFMLLSGSDALASELLSRLENLFPGSCIGGGVAAHQSYREQRGLLLVGPGVAGGGSITATSMEPGADVAAGAASRNATEGRGQSISGIAGGGSAGSGSGSGGPPSDLEGPFQRMLLDREGSGLPQTADIDTRGSSTRSGGDAGEASSITTGTASSAPNYVSASSTPGSLSGPEYASGLAALTDDSADSGIGSGASRGRKRRPPAAAVAPAANPAVPSTSGAFDAATAVVGSDLQSTISTPSNLSEPVASPTTSAPSASTTAKQDDETGTRPSLVLVGDQVYSGGAALLAVYPRTAAATVAAAGSADGPGAADAGPGRLSGAACDRLARVVLGADQLHYVSLRGEALTAISPPPTGPELIAAYPAAPENPYYWWPAEPALPRLVIDPHQDASARSDTDTSDTVHCTGLDPATCAGYSVAGHQAGAVPGQEPGGSGARADRLQSAEDTASAGGVGGAGDDVEEADGNSPSAAALAALSEGLVGLPLFPLENTLLFPGQTIHLRIYEKRYRLLMRACLEQGAAFGLCWHGIGSTAVVRGYQRPESDSADILVLLEGGMRFSYKPEDLHLQPASYGLNMVKRAEYVVDDAPLSEADCAAMMAAAHTIMDGIAGALEASSAPKAQHAARTFANALHFASSQQQQPPSTTPELQTTDTSPTGGPSTASPGSAPSAAVVAASAQAAPSVTAADAAQTGPDTHADNPESDAALLAADLAEAKKTLDADTASLLSLYLAPHIPVHLESVRRQWFTTRNTLWRLQQEASWLRSNQRVCLAVASSVLRLPREHPLRVMLGLSRVAAVL